MNKEVKRGKANKVLFSQEQVNFILCSYSNDWNIQQIAKFFNVSNPIIRKVLLENNIVLKKATETNRRKKLNTSFFSVIKTREQAYWLGFLYADGYINTHENRVRLHLSSKDKNHLYKFRHILGAEHLVSDYLQDKRYFLSYISLGSKELTNDLVNLGCFNNKTYTLRFPTEDIVPKHFLSHFIRGYFDGDGSIFFNIRQGKHLTRKNYSISFTGNINFITELMKQLELNLKLDKKPDNSDIVNLKISGNLQVETLLKFLYKDSHELIRLDRKYCESMNCLQYLKDNPPVAWNKQTD